MPDPEASISCAAIVVAAGSSRRMGFDKLAAPLGGRPVLLRTLDAFVNAACVDSVVVVCPEDRWNSLGAPVFKKPVVRVDGGMDRQDSVARGLSALPRDARWVAVHDGARPLIPAADIARCLDEARAHRAAALARRVTETLKRSDTRDFSNEAVPRENLWFMETPQVFSVDLLRKAYDHVTRAGLTVTDEVSAVEALGVPVKLIESSGPNPKITTPADLQLAEALSRP